MRTQNPWPRTNVEKVLHEMFEGSAAQLMAIVETLHSAHRRPLVFSPGASEQEFEILDVYSELFLAGKEILAGGGGASIHGGRTNLTGVPAIQAVSPDGSLLEFATAGSALFSFRAHASFSTVQYSIQLQ